MPYVPSASEAARLRAAIDRAAFTEFERIAWLFSFVAIIVVEMALVGAGASAIGVVGALGGFAVLYWRLRGGHLLRRGAEDRELHGVGLRTREQRAFTGLMLRHVFTGTNPLRPKVQHDPMAAWGQRVERQVVEEAPSE